MIRHVREFALTAAVRQRRELYAANRSVNEILQWQLAEFNRRWQEWRHRVPYYKRLCEEAALPKVWADWEQFRTLCPPLDRQTIFEHRAALVDPLRPPQRQLVTGGSTSEPVRLPAWNCESRSAGANMWFARGRFGIRPSDRAFLLWGHSHLLGDGFRGKVNGWLRQQKDRLLGYYRWSAYEIGQEQLQAAADALVRFAPNYALGYAAALDRFCRINADRKREFRSLSLKGIVATGESFPQSDSQQLIEDTFGCPVIIEYGAVETGPLAYSHPDGGLEGFWHDYHFDAEPAAGGGYALLVTSLQWRCFPLLRYQIGDLISDDPRRDDFDYRFDHVVGRCNDTIELADGSAVHSEALSHCLRDVAAIQAFQVVQDSHTGALGIDYIGPRELTSAETQSLQTRLGKIHTALRVDSLVRKDALEQSLAGKTKRIVRR